MAIQGTPIIYSINKKKLSLEAIAAASVKIALVSSAYTPDASVSGHSSWTDVSAHEISAGNGYSAGGILLSGLQLVSITNGSKLVSLDAIWTATGGAIPAWRTAIMYVVGTISDAVNPLVCYIPGDATPADVPATATGNPLKIMCPIDGWLDIS